MQLKNKLLDLSKTYEEMRKEAFKIVKTIKSKVRNISDAQIIQSLIEKKDFYWKHDLETLRILAENYKIKTNKLEEIWKKYIEIEQILLKNKSKFEHLGLKDVTFGPKTLLSASGDKKSDILIYPKDREIDIRVYPEIEYEDIGWTEDFEKFAKELKNKIRSLTEKNL